MEKLTKAHRRLLRSFSSGEQRVDEWLQQRALSAQNKHGSVTRILLEGEVVAGFHTLALGDLAIDHVPVDLFGTSGPPTRPPRTVTLAWLGVDERFARRGLGRELVHHALAVCYRTYVEIPFVAVIVDALTARSATFFKGVGFTVIPGTDGGACPGLACKLYLSAPTLIAAVEAPPAAEGGVSG